MRASRDGTEATVEPSLAAWFGFWAQFVVLGLLVVIGCFSASEGEYPGDYACGMLLALGGIALAFMRLKRQFDGAPGGWSGFLLIEDMRHLALVIPLFSVLALAGLFVAAGWEYGSLHNAGIALFIVSGAFVFLNMKSVFDRLDSRG